MKKFILTLSTVIMLMGLVIGTMTLTGCWLKEALLGPTNEWCEKEISYDGTALIVYMMYCDGDYSSKTTVDDDTFDWSKKGLFIVVTGYNEKTSQTNIVGSLTDKKYSVVFWQEGKALEKDSIPGDDEDINTSKLNIKCDRLKWGLVYNSDVDIYESADDRLPLILRENSGYTKLTDFSNFSWKKVLAQILIDKLL